VRSSPSVFLNVPFDRGYEPQFIALMAAIIAIGRTPRCVLEIAEVGAGRLSRILGLINECEVSVHDLSRVGTPARFNMPFELGLACAISRLRRRHAFILLEREPHRLQRTLSDLNGHDPYIHGGRVRGTIDCVVNALRPRHGAPDPHDVYRLYRTMCAAAGSLAHGKGSVFSRSMFLDLIAVGIGRAKQTQLLLP
jgi:hypothetical protein